MEKVRKEEKEKAKHKAIKHKKIHVHTLFEQNKKEKINTFRQTHIND